MAHDVLLPERLVEPLELHQPLFGRPRLSRRGGGELPTDQWGNTLVESVDGHRVRVQPTFVWSQFSPGVHIDDELVLLRRPLPTHVRVALLCVLALAVFAGGALGAVLGMAAVVLAERLLRGTRRSAPVRYAQAAGVIVAAVLAYLAVLAVLGLVLHR